MSDVGKIALGVFWGLYGFMVVESVIVALDDSKSASLRTAEAVEKIAAECAVAAREKEGGE